MPPSRTSTADPDDRVARIADTWCRLAAAVADRGSPWRTPVVATGSPVAARVMVLRGVDVAAATLTFFTDARAAKVAALTVDPRIAVVAYDPIAQVQVRLTGTAAIATEGRAVAASWREVPPAGRRSYTALPPPGTQLAGARLGQGARPAFAVLTVMVEMIDRLDLAGTEHVRIVARRDQQWAAARVAP